MEPHDIKRGRLLLGLKQQEFATLVGITREHLSRIENGAPAGPDTLNRIESILATVSADEPGPHLQVCGSVIAPGVAQFWARPEAGSFLVEVRAGGSSVFPDGTTLHTSADRKATIGSLAFIRTRASGRVWFGRVVALEGDVVVSLDGGPESITLSAGAYSILGVVTRADLPS